MIFRDTAKAKSAAKQIRNISGNGNVAVEKLDLASLDSVEQFSKKIIAQEERIDIYNAGIMMCPKWKTKDGFEMQFGTNQIFFLRFGCDLIFFLGLESRFFFVKTRHPFFYNSFFVK
ncbi:retinol dehydrogenase 13-like [Brachionus plicatilis]|uniref:Retinol dehydrogenase 13-like n=1 Tax=Brachionus plicatilis TaxID=10195 RepID=A0A3M7P7S6_BRAPC|nr:retinol dehydrogenase 13-like [Brachionus plicatilis]